PRKKSSCETKPIVPSFPSVHPALRICALGRAARQNQKSSECRFFHASSQCDQACHLAARDERAKRSQFVGAGCASADGSKGCRSAGSVKCQMANAKWQRTRRARSAPLTFSICPL